MLHASFGERQTALILDLSKKLQAQAARVDGLETRIDELEKMLDKSADTAWKVVIY